MLERVRHFLCTGAILEQTCFPAAVVRLERPAETLMPEDRLFYGQYKKGDRTLLAILGGLTDGHYRDGAMARILMRESWSRGKAPTFREFASAWLQATREHAGPNPEWAFLSDRARKNAGANWKREAGAKSGGRDARAGADYKNWLNRTRRRFVYNRDRAGSSRLTRCDPRSGVKRQRRGATP
jgi:hypothetical protein